ncbi:MAG: Dabb family protein [Eubacteriales bacterium]|nr:Dabb family protein [Eubacteriales bacterium]
MRHHILAKYNQEVKPEQKDQLADDILHLFENTKSIPGIHQVEVHKNCINRENRYDILIVIEMDQAALEEYDRCEWHKQWKEEYGKLLEKKAIFDCE